MNNSRLKLCLRAVYDTLPLCIGVLPWGILTGALAIQVGFNVWQAQAMSLLVFAGAAQLSAMTLFSSGASNLSLMTSTFVISSRHLLYSVIFRQHVMQLSVPKKLVIGFLLTDEMFAVSEAHTRSNGFFSPLYAAVSGFTFYLTWNITTAIGIFAGEKLTNLDDLGLDFAIVATFIAMTFDQLRDKTVFLAIVSSGVLAVMLQPFFDEAYIVIAAIGGMLIAYSVSSLSGNNKKEPNS